MLPTSPVAVRIAVNTPDGRRSSLVHGQTVMAAALAATDPGASRACSAERNWRKGYIEHFAASTRQAATSARAALAVATDGLDAFGHHMRLVSDGGEAPLSAPSREDAHDVRAVAGSHEPVTTLEVPYRGELLHDRTLRDQLRRWVDAGVVEPAFASSIHTVMDTPELLKLPGRTVVVVGAGAALGPTSSLLRWGARVAAVDVPVPAVWDRLERLARDGAGTLLVPVDRTTGLPGLHLCDQLAATLSWVDRVVDGTSPVLGMYAYADGAQHVEATAAADVIAQDLLGGHDSAMLAYLATPTDAFLTPMGAVEQAGRRWEERSWNGPQHRLARAASLGKLFRPAYDQVHTDDHGRSWGLIDALVAVQGPNYALAKRAQRWRAATAAGRRVSATVAPASWTASVTKNRVLASVYAGAHRFGVEIFDADTVSVLMAAKLAADAVAPTPDLSTWHPESLFANDAAHGGLWRQPFDPRSALGVAAALGAGRR